MKRPNTAITEMTADQISCGEKNSRVHNPLGSQKGQVIIELALMMPFLAVILLALVIVYELSAKQVNTMETLRQEMRESINAAAAGPFRPDTEKMTIWVHIPGKMKEIFNTPFITQDLKIDYYKGSYHGYKLTRYHNRGRRIREINY